MKSYFIFAFILILVGCVHLKKDDEKPVIVFEKESTKLGEVSSSLKRESDKIGEISNGGVVLSDKCYEDTKNVNFNTLKGKFETINSINTDVGLDINKINEINDNLIASNKDIMVVNNKLQKEVEKYKSDSLKSMKMVWCFVGALSAVILCFGVATSVFYKPNFGVPFVLTGIALASISYFMVAYIKLVAIIGGIVFVAGIAYIIYQMYLNRKAIKESVMTVEATKYKIWDDIVKQDVDLIQSPSTKKIVASVKKEIDNNLVKKNKTTDVNKDSKLDEASVVVKNNNTKSSKINKK